MRRWRATRCLLLALVAAAIIAVEAAADPLNVVWAVRGGGPGHDKARGIAVDWDGNVYVTGEFTQTVVFGEHTVTSRGDLDFFIAKYNRNGNCLWVRSGGGALIDRGYAVAVDRDQNCYVTGHYQSTDARFDQDGPLLNRGGYDVFVAKYDSGGALQWVRTGGGTGYDYGHGIGVDRAGDCYVTGGSPGAVTFGDLTTGDQRGSRMFLWKLAPDGRTRWARASEGGSSSGQGMAVAPDGHCWIAGDVSGAVDFMGERLSRTGKDAVVVKVGPDGTGIWASGGSGGKDAFGSAVSVDDAGDCYLTGGFQTTETVGTEAMQSAGGYDVFVAKLDDLGRVRWARAGGGPGVDYCLGSASDLHGGCYAVGCFHDGAVFDGVARHSEGDFDLFAAHYDAAGKLSGLLQGGGPGLDEAYCGARTDRNELCVSGAFSGTSSYGGKSLTSAGSNDVELLKLRLR